MYSPADLGRAIAHERKAIGRYIAARDENIGEQHCLHEDFRLHLGTLACITESARLLAVVKGGEWRDVTSRGLWRSWPDRFSVDHVAEQQRPDVPLA